MKEGNIKSRIGHDMPLPKPKKNEKETVFITRCMGDNTVKKEFPDQKQRTAICFKQFRNGGECMNPKVKENLKFKFTKPFSVIKESAGSVDENTRKIRGTMVEFDVPSRNERVYTKEAVHGALFTGNNISLNHSEDVTDNVGIFKPIKTEEGWDFEAEVTNTGKHPYVTQMVDKGLFQFVSIEAIAKTINTDKEGNMVVEDGLDITGLGIVKTPGFPSASFALAEAFKEKGDLMEKKIIEQDEE